MSFRVFRVVSALSFGGSFGTWSGTVPDPDMVSFGLAPDSCSAETGRRNYDALIRNPQQPIRNYGHPPL